MLTQRFTPGRAATRHNPDRASACGARDLPCDAHLSRCDRRLAIRRRGRPDVHSERCSGTNERHRDRRFWNEAKSQETAPFGLGEGGTETPTCIAQQSSLQPKRQSSCSCLEMLVLRRSTCPGLCAGFALVSAAVKNSVIHRTAVKMDGKRAIALNVDKPHSLRKGSIAMPVLVCPCFPAPADFLFC